MFRVPLPGAKGLTLDRAAVETIRAAGRNHLLDFAGSMAYYSFLALAPLLVLSISLLGVFDAEFLVIAAIQGGSDFLPAPALEVLEDQLLEVAQREARSPFAWGALSFILLTLWGVSRVMRAGMRALNRIWHDPEIEDSWWKESLHSIWIFSVCATIVGLAFALVVIGDDLLLQALGIFGITELSSAIWQWIYLPFVVMMVQFAFAIFYHWAPKADRPWDWTTHGTLFSATAWILFSFGLVQYVEHSQGYGSEWGPLLGGVLILLYAWWSSLIVLLGAELDHVIACHKCEWVDADVDVKIVPANENDES